MKKGVGEEAFSSLTSVCSHLAGRAQCDEAEGTLLPSLMGSFSAAHKSACARPLLMGFAPGRYARCEG